MSRRAALAAGAFAARQLELWKGPGASVGVVRGAEVLLLKP